MTEACIFCSKVEQGQEFFRDHSGNFLGIWSDQPAFPAHGLLITKAHRPRFDDLTQNELDNLGPAIKEVRVEIQRLIGKGLLAIYSTIELPKAKLGAFAEFAAQHPGVPQDFNFGNNDGPNAGQTVNHFHTHIIPRWEVDQGGILSITKKGVL